MISVIRQKPGREAVLDGFPRLASILSDKDDDSTADEEEAPSHSRPKRRAARSPNTFNADVRRRTVLSELFRAVIV